MVLAMRPTENPRRLCFRRRTAALRHAKQDKTYWWEVRDAAGELVCLTVYRRGAREVVCRLSLATI